MERKRPSSAEGRQPRRLGSHCPAPPHTESSQASPALTHQIALLVQWEEKLASFHPHCPWAQGRNPGVQVLALTPAWPRRASRCPRLRPMPWTLWCNLPSTALASSLTTSSCTPGPLVASQVGRTTQRHAGRNLVGDGGARMGWEGPCG